MNRVARFTRVILVTGLAATLVAATSRSVVFAQAGAVGGAIGKQNKSVSGDEAAPPPVAAESAKKRKSAAASDSKQTRPDGDGHCGAIAGMWTANGWWNAIYGRGDVVLNSDGSARHNSGIVGTWTCSRRHFIMDWKNWSHGEGTLSGDGNTVNFEGGGTMTRGR